MSTIKTIRDDNGRAVKYLARFRTPEGASRSKTFKRKIDAEQFLSTITVASAQGNYIDAGAGKVTFGDFARQWIANQPHRPSTASSVESAFRVHVLPLWEDRPIATIRPSEVQAWVSSLGLAPSTVAVVYGKVAAVFRAAVEDRVLAVSPCGRKIRLPRAEGSEVTPMTPDEVRAMAEAVNERYRALIVTMAGTGLRPAEALGLTVDRVNFLKRTIRVDRQLVTAVGELPDFGPTKTPSSVRTIPAAQAVFDVLAAHLQTYPTGHDGLIFTDTNGNPIRRNALGHIWRRAMPKAKVVDRTPHDCRHYAASVMIHQGSSVKAVQKQLGHASATTTLDTYAHLWPDSEDRTRRALDAGMEHVVSQMCHGEVTSPQRRASDLV